MARLTALAPAALLLLLAFGLAWAAMRPPTVVPASAPAAAFSADRAMATVRLVSARSHPSGSPEASSVRAALAARLRALGYKVFRLRGIGAGVSGGSHPSAQAGDVETLVAILPGRRRALPAVAMMAHTDSVPGSFGAADDGFGVATALESARALATGERPARDVVLILTDGEEAGLLGARLFFADPARAHRLGALVNVDSRGTSGLGTMFETGPGSGGLLARYRATASHRFAHSAATFLYHQLPNRTDLTATAGLDLPALNFAFLAGEFDYHTPRDALASVDPRTLQSLGDQVLPVVRALADDARPLPRGGDGVFAEASPIVALRYPAWLGWPLLALAAGLAAFGLRGAGPAAAAGSAAIMLAGVIAAALAARGGYLLTGVGHDWGAHHRIMAAFGRYELALILAGGACLLGTGALLRRRAPAAVRAGTLAIGLLLSLAAQALAPALTPLVVWPTLAATGGALVERRLRHGRWVAGALAVFPLAYLLVVGHAVLLALGIPMPEAVALFVLLAAPLVLPLAGGWPPVLAGAMLAVAAGLMGSFRADAPSERYPALSQLLGVADEAGHGWLVSPLERPDAWTRAMLVVRGAVPERIAMPLVSDDPVWRVPMAVALPRPAFAGVRSGEWATLTVTPATGGRTIRLRLVTDRALPGMTVGGRPLPVLGGHPGTFMLRWQSPGLPLVLRFRATQGTRIDLTAAETSERRLSLPPRPVDVVPWLGSDRLIAIRHAVWRIGPPAPARDGVGSRSGRPSRP